MSASRPIDAVFENGVFRPLAEVKLPEHQRVSIVVMPDDAPADLIARAAEDDGSFGFLASEAEDVYSPEEGEPI